MKFDLNYHISGEGIPFVFQHGLGASLEQAIKLMDNLEGTQLISIDQNGHGQSILKSGITPSFNLYADNVMRLLDELKIEKAVFGGISMGSGISLNIALRYPERVKALVLVRPAWLGEKGPENLQILVDVANYLNKGLEAIDFKSNSNFIAFKALSEGASQSVLRMFIRVQGEHTAKVLTSMVNDRPFSSLEDLKKIEQPTIIFASDNDPLHPYSMGPELQSCIPNSTLEKVIARYLDDSEHSRIIRASTQKFINQLNH